jgi:hypothetical protein
MPLTDRENYLRTARLQGGEWIPSSVGMSGATWTSLREELEDVVARHPLFFPNFKKGQHDYDKWDYGPAHRPNEKFKDNWGCVWDNAWGGLEGQVVEHPLADWSALATYKPPDPLVLGDRGPVDWEKNRENTARAAQEGRLTSGGVPHGFMLMRLWYLRGFENLMLDMAENRPELRSLIRMLTDHNMALIRQWLSMNVDMVSFGEDLGAQTASIVSPRMFREWIAPAYRDLMKPGRDAACEVYLHSDGYIMELIDDLIAAGVTIINPQDLCNGIDDLARQVKGRVCISLDVDRQKIVPFGTRREIRELIREEVMKLGSPRGGLMLVCGIYPPTPAENVDAVCCAMEEFRTYWWDGRASGA